MRHRLMLVMMLGLLLLPLPGGLWAAADDADAPVLNDAQQARLHQAIAALTRVSDDDLRRVQAMLLSFGAAALPDLAQLSDDPTERTRIRVALTLGLMRHTRATELLIEMSDDSAPLVREAVALALGATGAATAVPRLVEMLRDDHATVRESAAVALGQIGDARALLPLSHYHQAGGRLAALIPAPGQRARDAVQAIRQGMYQALLAVATRPQNVPRLGELLTTQRDQAQLGLLEISAQIGDPRLTPALVQILGQGDSAAVRLAAASLGANGDSRCLQALCALAAAAQDVRVRESAAGALRRLTGHPAGPGQAWLLWWRDHRDAVSALAERDRFIASLHDPATRPTAADLARFTPQQLLPLVSGVLGDGAAWWPPLALRALLTDDARRWTPVLAQRLDATSDPARRVRLIVLLDALGDPAAQAVAAAQLHALNERAAAAAQAAGQRDPRPSSERAVLELLLHQD